MYTVEYIKGMIETNDRWLRRGVLAIYEYQTIREQNNAKTIERNDVGFNGVDAPFLTSIAQQLLQARYLTAKQIMYTRKLMLKYAGQLTRIANKEQ